MDTLHEHGWRRQGLLYPMMLIAAMSVIVFSVLGIATMTGLLPSAVSGYRPEAQPPQHASKSLTEESHAAAPQAAAVPCLECGIVSSVRALDTPGQETVLGAVAGGVVGGMVGSETGEGRGRAMATVLGASPGAGNEFEKNATKRVAYQIRVHMSDGKLRSFYQSTAPSVRVGQKVRVVKGRVVAMD